MELPVHFIENDRWTVDMPHCFLDQLLESGHQFDSGILCLELKTPYNTKYYCCMNEFTPQSVGTINIPDHLNRYLNVVEETYIHVCKTTMMRASQVIVQAHRNAFNDIDNLKEKLEVLFSNIKIINSNMALELEGQPFDVITLSDMDMNGMSAGLIVEGELEIVFLQTLEGIEIEKEQMEILAEIELQRQRQLESQKLAEEEIGRAHV
mgnify:CR=1 FL=1